MSNAKWLATQRVTMRFDEIGSGQRILKRWIIGVIGLALVVLFLRSPLFHRLYDPEFAAQLDAQFEQERQAETLAAQHRANAEAASRAMAEAEQAAAEETARKAEADRAENQRSQELAYNSASTDASGMTLAAIDRLTTYAVLLGRGVGCGVNTQSQMARVGGWLDRVAPPGSSDQQIYLPMFMAVVEQNAKAQVSGQSPDTCGAVAGAISRHPWP